MTPRPKILNTRPLDQAAELSALLSQASLEPVEAPTIEVVPAWQPAQVTNLLHALRADAYAWLVLPSRNAARLLLEAIGEVGGSAADLASVSVLSGTGTARVLETYGVRVTRSLERFSAAAALDALAADRRLVDEGIGRRVLVPRAAEGRDELVLGLAARGVPVDAPIFYRTRHVPSAALSHAGDLLTAGAIAAVTFTSPSTMAGLVAGLRGLGMSAETLLAQPALVCLSTTTADAVRAAGFEVARVADRTSLGSLVQAVRLALPAAVP